MEKTKVPPCMESGIHFFIPTAGVSLLRHKDIKPLGSDASVLRYMWMGFFSAPNSTSTCV